MSQPAADSSKHAWIWGGVVVGFLLFTIVTQTILVLFATGDPSVAAEPDYYRKAVDWDAHRAQLAHNQALGWKLAVTPGEATPLGRRSLRVALTDRAGAPLTGAAVQLRAFHKARRNRVLQATCAADGDGYRAELPLRRAGLYELRFEVTRGEERFTQVIEQDLPSS